MESFRVRDDLLRRRWCPSLRRHRWIDTEVHATLVGHRLVKKPLRFLGNFFPVSDGVCFPIWLRHFMLRYNNAANITVLSIITRVLDYSG